jgi:predicted metalloprotease with PDZ domain
MVRLGDHARKSIDLMYSIGAMLKEDGSVMDVNPDLEAAKAGLAPGMKIITVNGRGWSTDVLREAITAAKSNTTPIELVAENGSFTGVYKLNYHGGERYPHLERDSSKPDLLGEVIKPRR